MALSEEFTRLFYCSNLEDKNIAQNYLDRVVSFQDKKWGMSSKPIYKALGGEENYIEAKKIIRGQELLILKNFKDAKIDKKYEKSEKLTKETDDIVATIKAVKLKEDEKGDK